MRSEGCFLLIAPKKARKTLINPKSHAEILESIVDADSKKSFIKTKIESALAVSLRVDGSVDRTNMDKIYVLAKIVNEIGKLELIFLGVGVY